MEAGERSLYEYTIGTMGPLSTLSRAVLLAVLACTSLLAQEKPDGLQQPNGSAVVEVTPSAAVAPSLAKGRLTGKVTCGDTRQPARGAMVMLQSLSSSEVGAQGGLIAARVGLDGSYTLEHVASGDYGVLAFLPGYLSPADDLVVDGDAGEQEKALRERLVLHGAVHIAAEGTQTSDVVLERGAVVSGRVLYADGSPASQVTIELEEINTKAQTKPGQPSFNFGGILRALLTHQSQGTDDQGRFRISGLHAGTYRVAAVEPFNLAEAFAGGGDDAGAAGGIGLLGGIGNPKALHFYACDTIHKKDAKTYELRAGDTLSDLDIRLPIDGFRSVRVKLAATDGRPIERATLTLADHADEALFFHASGKGEGVFEFATIPPGTYTLTASAAMIGGRFGPPTAAFADGSASVLVKEGDPPEVRLELKEIPLPKGPLQPQPGGESLPDR